MSAPRPVEPVVGMEFYVEDEPWPYKVARVLAGAILCTNADPLRHGEIDCYSRNFWIRWQEKGRLRPVLWTVGPSERPYTRLCHDDDRGEYRDVFCMHTPCKCREGCRNYVALWPTKAAALAAGKAYGWSEPVARRVVRR